MAAIDITGQRFGRLTAQSRLAGQPTRWNCRCDCGRSRPVLFGLLRAGKAQSCGCWQAESRSLRGTHHRSRSRVYNIWCGMISRCRLTDRPESKHYSLKGIRVCKRWQSFENFLADMGEPPPRTTIERNDGSGNYEPGNCRWATQREQRHNTSDALHVEYRGVVRPLAVLAEEAGLKYHTVYVRIKRHGWSVEQALTLRPLQGRGCTSRA